MTRNCIGNATFFGSCLTNTSPKHIQTWKYINMIHASTSSLPLSMPGHNLCDVLSRIHLRFGWTAIVKSAVINSLPTHPLTHQTICCICDAGRWPAAWGGNSVRHSDVLNAHANHMGYWNALKLKNHLLFSVLMTSLLRWIAVGRRCFGAGCVLILNTITLMLAPPMQRQRKEGSINSHSIHHNNHVMLYMKCFDGMDDQRNQSLSMCKMHIRWRQSRPNI